MQGKVYIRTFGCQMNVKDTQRMMGLLAEAGYLPVDDPELADVILVNTCSVRKKPEQKLFGVLGRYKQLKDARPSLVIGVGGCVAQQMGNELLEDVPHLDLVFGTQNIHRLPELLERARSGERMANVEWLDPGDPDLFKVPGKYVENKVTSFVSIMQGCDNCCAYCIVPRVRGPAMSRNSQLVQEEVSSLARSGVKEVTLLGQNVNAYCDNGIDFPELLEKVADVSGISRVRFTTSHPKDLSDKLIETLASHPRVMEAIHIPVQAGSDSTLSRMNRGYTRDHYLGLVAKLREAVPQIGITTDLIVGFPGETEDDFNETLSLIEKVGYDETFSFRYSRRPGTKAADFPGQVVEKEKYDRLYKLQDLQRIITEGKNHEQVGKVHEVLVEGSSKTDPTRWSGRSRTNRLVHFAKPGSSPGQSVGIKVTRALKHSLEGEIVAQEFAA